MAADFDMLLMLEKGIRSGMSHTIHPHPKANDRFIKVHDTNNESSYTMYSVINNFYGQAMLQKLLVDDFEWRKDTFMLDEDFFRNYDEDIDTGEIFEVSIKYPRHLYEAQENLQFLSERIKIENCQKLV